MKIVCLFRSEMSGVRRHWTILFLILLSSYLSGFLQAQAPYPEPPAAPPPQNAPQQLSQEELNRLLGPIALYPDALVALILPASTVPSDLVLAARYVASNGDPAQVANQPWDDSVKSLVRYPELVKWMDQNLEWTTAVGEAFLDQPADVMNSIQALRAQPIAAGNLTDTSQQRVVREKTCVRIVPAEPEVIYVPEYDPEVVYVQPYSEDVGPLLTFSAGFAVGSWLNYDCDWDRRGIYVGQWRPGWNQYRNWDHGDRDPNWDRWNEGPNWDRGGRGHNNSIVNVVNINSDNARQWQPSVNSQRRQAQYQRGDRSSARFSSVNALDANRQSGGASGTAITGGRGKSHKAPAPTVAPNVPDEQGTPFQGGGQGGNRRNSNKHAQGRDQNLPPDVSGVTNAAPGGRGKNHKAPAPTIAPNVPREQQGTPFQGGGQNSAPRNLSKHAQGSHHSTGRVNNQGAALPSNGSTPKPQKHVDQDRSSPPQSNNAPHSSNGQKHQQKHAPQSQPSHAKQSKSSQPPPAAAHHEEHSQRSSASAQQNNAPQPSNGSHGKGKGKGGGKNKTNEEKNNDHS